MYTKKWTDEEDELGKRLVSENVNIDIIAERLGRTAESISIRKRSVWGFRRERAGEKTNQFFFDTWTPESAYIFGFILTDGHVRKNKKAVSIVQSHSYGKEHLQKIQKLVGGSLYSTTKDDSYSLALIGTRICERLVSLGIPAGAKSGVVIWPEFLPQGLYRHFIRGVFDGDGSISGSIRANGCYVYSINFTSGSKEFCSGLHSVLSESVGVSGSVCSPIAAPNVFYISYGAADSERILNWCYAGATICLDRKRDYFETAKKTKEVQRALDAKRLKKNRVIEGYPETPSWYSAFNPALAEAIIGMWSDSGDTVLDPCAGWGTRAEAALRLGRKYIGFDASPRAIERVTDHMSKFWNNSVDYKIINDDGCLLTGVADESADFIFTCPPYWDLEKYEGDNSQLSVIPTYHGFLEKIRLMLINSYRALKRNRFIVMVAGSYRKDGKYIPFSEDLFQLMRDVGFVPHETDALSNLVKSSFNPVRAGEQRSFSVCREVLCVFQKVFNPTENPIDTDDVISRARKYSMSMPPIKEPRKIVSTWTKEMDECLVDGFKDYMSVKDIATELGRSVSGVHKRIKILGLTRDESVVEQRRREKIAEKAEKRWQDPERKKVLSERMTDYWGSEENRANQSKRITEWHESKDKE